MSTPPTAAPVWHLYVPKLFTVLRRGAGTRVILSGLGEQPRAILAQMGVRPDGGDLQLAANFAEALTLAGAVR